MDRAPDCAERRRLADWKNWRRWGPYVADRAWGTVREDYSADGAAWRYLTHDMARSRAYRWGEDGIAGICDEQQTLCLSLAMWNGVDPILKERFFGLTNEEGNHGEDVKELYWYLDCTPTHSYMKFLYKYPQVAFPYEHLLTINHGRKASLGEYEILDTGIFDQARYFDVFVEYAKASPDEICMLITAANRGPAEAVIHLIPQLWFRNTWAWGAVRKAEPIIEDAGKADKWVQLHCRQEALGDCWLYGEQQEVGEDEAPVGHALQMVQPEVLFTDNETNTRRLYQIENPKAYVKDAFHRHIVNEKRGAVNPLQRGTKAALHYLFWIPPNGQRRVRVILSRKTLSRPAQRFDATLQQRLAEADEFYDSIHHPNLGPEERRVQRQALAGLLWSRQFYLYDVDRWLEGDNAAAPPPPQRHEGRNSKWRGLCAGDVMAMPDKWEYPWFASWDMAFHAVTLAMVDIQFAKQQLELLISERFMHSNGQLPAYEWEFSDVNPPVHAWGVWRVYNMEKHEHAEHGDLDFLERCYHKLLLNFTWWVNRKDAAGRNIFQGGFLGLDNVSVFDRSQPLPGGGWLEQADATGWMALYALNMMAIGLELAQHKRIYEHLAVKFFEHFLGIASAINREIEPGLSLWSEEDGWYYDVVHEMTDGVRAGRALRVRSLVGLVPLFAAQVLKQSWFDHLPAFRERHEWLIQRRPDLSLGMSCVWTPDGAQCLLSIVNYDRMHRILARVLDEKEFLSDFGLRSLSRYHLNHPYQVRSSGRQWTVRYEPGESITKLFGGNSNWRGPVWFPTAFMLMTALRVYDRFYAENVQLECPTGSGRRMSLNEIAMELGRRMCALFLPDAHGQRPAYTHAIMQSDPHFRDLLLFHEYFHGETGMGLGASHQTGWTALVAKLLDQQAVYRTGRTRKPAATNLQRV